MLSDGVQVRRAGVGVHSLSLSRQGLVTLHWLPSATALTKPVSTATVKGLTLPIPNFRALIKLTMSRSSLRLCCRLAQGSRSGIKTPTS